VTRFAPSPTGDLHLGSAFTALASWAVAARAGGRFLLRVEDIDTPRVVAGAEARQLDDLSWLGIAWDGEIVRQSERQPLYDAALDQLTTLGLTYPCDCSRAEIARVASAPHAGEEIAYPGTCRDKSPSRSFRRPPAVRLRLASTDVIDYADQIAGPIPRDALHAAGDFVLRRGDGVYAYQLAVSVDDLAMGITDVVRGSDLIPSTPRQLLLMRLLGASALPRYWHLPLVTGPDGDRLAKRTHGTTVRELREAGIPRDVVLGHLAFGLGLEPSPEAISGIRVLTRTGARPVFRREPWAIPSRWTP
jgi:glutamyl-tRNA synthetase